jgi:hypothetical protein
MYVEGQENKLFRKQPNTFSKIRNQKILDYAKRYSNRTDTEKEAEFEGLNEEQEKWSKKRLAVLNWTWQRWDGDIEEWIPWNRYGEPINEWRFYK